jgi:Copper type II ascorbate-dependent monooxygenase, C-terminal domain
MRRLLLSFVLLSAACSSNSKDEPPRSVAAGETFSVGIGPIDVPAGVERTQCVVKRLKNPATIRVGRMDNTISDASHHMIVYRSSDTAERATPFDCEPFVETLDPSKGSPIMITQKHTDFIELPAGVAYTLDAGQMIRLELHYINTGANAVSVSAKSTFTAMAAADFQQEAAFLFIGTLDISLPPKSATTIGPTYFPLPSDFQGVDFFAITGHTHQYGLNVQVEAASGDADPGTSVYDVPGWLWSEPKTVFHDPPFQVPSGGGFRFQCDYENTSDKTVSFGESAKAEMCFFWAYYYPSAGSKVCLHTKKIGSGADFCCPGAVQCAFLGF